MALSKPDLLRLLEEGEIVCEPRGKVSNCSIDIRLGSTFFRQEDTYDPVFPYEGSDTTPVWKPEPAPLMDFNGAKVIRIDAGELILATSFEFIGARREHTTMLKSTSTFARMCLDVCASAGWGDPGYVNRWAFPLMNRGTRTVFLKPETFIAQIVFLNISTPLEEKEGYLQQGSYQKEAFDITKTIESWDPKSVLPKFLKL
jgi:deoxycytidine triphosphate deaminase